MSHDLYTYGGTDPIVFALTDANGDGVTGHSLIAADVKLSSIDDGTPTYNTTANIGTECSEGDNGFYYWEPSNTSQTQHDVLLIFVNDSAGSAFVENRLVIATGGNASARFSG